MNRIMIIGCCGAGKSTLSRQLHEVTRLPLYHLDQYYWKPNWTETPKEEWKEIVTNLANKDKWIIDGNYGGTMDIRFDRADTIVYLDIHTIVCLNRVIKRVWKYQGQVRPDMPEGCMERFDFDFLHYVATYNLQRRNKIIAKLDVLSNQKKVYHIKNNNDIEALMAELKN